MWTVPGLYGLLMVLRLVPAEKPLPRWSGWLPILAHLGAWGWLAATSPTIETLFTHSLTMSWGLFALVVCLGTKLLDPQEQHPELFDAGLLLATALSTLWVAGLGAQLPTPMSGWELSAVWLVDFGGGTLLLLAILGWHIAKNHPKRKATLSRRLVQLQVLAALCFLGALLCALPGATRITLSQRGHVLFLLLAVGGLWIPTWVNARFAPAAVRWLFTGATFTIAWAFVRLFASV